MSAFMLSKSHIDYMVSAGKLWGVQKDPTRWKDNSVSQSVCNEIGAMLWGENERSLQARYGDEPSGDASAYRHRFTTAIDAVQVIKACHCFDYQACESEDYFDTKAAKWVAALKAEAVKHIPGFSEAYERAEWGISDNTTHTVEAISLADMARGES
jgi:hypothetical protein